MSVSISLYNTKTKNKEVFTPLVHNTVGIYSCGPTVYHYVHAGNLRAFIFADTLHRMFLYAGYTVRHVMNITDVGHLVSDGDEGEDKLEKGAKREGKSAWDVAVFYTDAFFQDLDALNITRSEYMYPRATDTIEEQINLVKALEEKGYTYRTTDGIYFDTARFPAYADFAKLDITGLQSGARVEENVEKKNVTDFALWKFSPKESTRDMEWQSPWGVGFPGWHIECSAMSKKYLGNHFDIHTGGIDHIPVHHTNEIAQSECANGEPFVNYWLHNNFLNDASGKMSKSSGDFLRLQTIIDKGISPLAFRYYLLTTHYRKEMEFSFEALDAASTAYTKLTTWCKENSEEKGVVIKSYQQEFEDALYDDINTPQIIALMWKMIKDTEQKKGDVYQTIISINTVLGLGLEKAHARSIDHIHISDEVRALADARATAKQNKDFATSDALRDQIRAYGYDVEDRPNGQEIVKK